MSCFSAARAARASLSAALTSSDMPKMVRIVCVYRAAIRTHISVLDVRLALVIRVITNTRLLDLRGNECGGFAGHLQSAVQLRRRETRRRVRLPARDHDLIHGRWACAGARQHNAVCEALDHLNIRLCVVRKRAVGEDLCVLVTATLAHSANDRPHISTPNIHTSPLLVYVPSITASMLSHLDRW